MKKITLKNLNIQEVGQLSREQLKDILGGYTGGTTGGTGTTTECTKICTCTNGPDSSITKSFKCDTYLDDCLDFCGVSVGTTAA